MKQHTGHYEYHHDDCRCVEFGFYCARDCSIWSCCGAGKKDSECSAPRTHPTYWTHPKHGLTVAGYGPSHHPRYKSNEEIRAVAPECFD